MQGMLTLRNERENSKVKVNWMHCSTHMLSYEKNAQINSLIANLFYTLCITLKVCEPIDTTLH